MNLVLTSSLKLQVVKVYCDYNFCLFLFEYNVGFNIFNNKITSFNFILMSSLLLLIPDQFCMTLILLGFEPLLHFDPCLLS